MAGEKASYRLKEGHSLVGQMQKLFCRMDIASRGNVNVGN